MALPTTRNTTYAPGSQVKSADLNDLQDQIIANNTRLAGGAGAAVSLALAMTAPDYHVGTAQPLFLSAVNGSAGGALAAEWSSSAGYMTGSTPAADWTMSIPVTFGETMTLTAYLELLTAVAGGLVNLTRVDPTTGTPTNVASIAIANATGVQAITVVTSHVVVTGAIYTLQFNCTSGAGGKKVYGAKKLWTR